MKIEAVLASNVDALMEASPTLNGQQRLSAASGVGQTNIGRIRRGEVAAQVDTVERIASAFKLRACDLLDPGLKERLARGEPLRMSEVRPPAMSDEDWARLSPRTRALIEDVARRALSAELSDDDIRLLHDTAERLSSPRGAPRT